MLLPLDTITALLYIGFVAFTRGLMFAESLPDEPATWSGFLLSTLAALTGLAAVSGGYMAVALRVLRKSSNPKIRGGLSTGAELGLRCLTVAAFIALTEWTGWPFAAVGLLHLPENDLTLQLAGIVPFLLLCPAGWAPMFPLAKKMLPGHWTLPSYLLHRTRYTLFVFGIWLPFTVLAEIAGWALEDITPSSNLIAAAQILLYAMIALGFWTFPYFLRKFWGAKPINDPFLRERVAALEAKAGVRFSEICLWDLGGGALMNAAAVGLLPPFRYLFLSKALLAKLSDAEVDAVICHEIGHVRHRHLVFYAVLTFAAMGLLQEALSPLSPAWQTGGVVAGLILYIRFGFGFVSRRFERQADLESLRLMGTSLPLRTALEKIAIAYGRIRHAKSWHHIGIAERVAFLVQAERYPHQLDRHDRSVLSLKRAGYLLAAAWVVWNVVKPETLAVRADQTPPSPDWQIRHWQRVRQLLPSSSRASEQLALWLREASPDYMDTALRLAEEALEKSRTEPERESARQLIFLLRHEAGTGSETALPDNAP